MVIISQYRQENKGNKVYIRANETPVCPICDSPLRVIGSRCRKVVGVDGIQQTFVVRRLRCTECVRIHHELPDLLIPYKRHCAETIEHAVSGNDYIGTVRSSTVRRIRAWWTQMNQYFIAILASLEAKYDIHFTAEVAPREIVRAVTNRQLWTHTRSVRLSG